MDMVVQVVRPEGAAPPVLNTGGFPRVASRSFRLHLPTRAIGPASPTFLVICLLPKDKYFILIDLLTIPSV